MTETIHENLDRMKTEKLKVRDLYDLGKECDSLKIDADEKKTDVKRRTSFIKKTRSALELAKRVSKLSESMGEYSAVARWQVIINACHRILSFQQEETTINTEGKTNINIFDSFEYYFTNMSL